MIARPGSLMQFEKLATRDGVEGALEALFRHGVYLTVDEFRGRRPVVRRDVAMAIDPTLSAALEISPLATSSGKILHLHVSHGAG